jgi:2-phosphosulfolactate phosphatase
MAGTAGEGSAHDQRGAGVRFEWGLAGARAITPPGGVVVVVDVLSFTTSTTVAVGKGTAVYPHRWPDPDIDAFAAAHDAVRAARRHEVTSDHPWSLSPSHLLAAPAAARLVLPSPNGSTIAAAMDSEGAGVVVAGCLRNATAVAGWLAGQGLGSRERPVAVVAAGEKWPTGELRPAIEDLLGAGAIIEALGLSDSSSPEVFSPEAEAAAAVWRAQRHHLADTLQRSSTGRQLTEGGHAPDIVVAAQFDAQDTVPVIVDGAFLNSSLH